MALSNIVINCSECHLLKNIILIFIISCSAFAETSLDAYKISYDSKKDIITAEGDVIISQNISESLKRELYSEKVVYNKKTGDLKFFGDTIIKECTGEIISAKNIEIDDKFKKAIINALIVVLNDNSKVKAKKGTKLDSFYTFDNASYTPCNESSCSAPLWDLLADKVTYDSKKKIFTYYKVKMRLKGVPVFYTPYFKHPGFGVKRQTGFLAPIIRSSKATGFYVGTPYFIVLDKDKDLKLTPFINFKKRGFVSSEYRQTFHNGDLGVTSSILTKSHSEKDHENEKKTRWHIDSKFSSYNLNNKRIRWRINRSSDMTYKLKYPVDSYNQSNEAFLQKKYNESNFIFDSFDKNYFLTADSYIFQTPDKDTQPVVMPHLNLNYRAPDCLTGTAEFDSDTISLSRDTEKAPNFSKSFFRSSNKFNWNKEIPINSILFDIKTGARADIYNIEKSENIKKTNNKIFPTIENQISAFLPMVSKLGHDKRSIWGPKVTFSSIKSFNNRKNFQQNEDSVFHSFDDLNLHSLNRFGLYDKIEDGERISAGIENSIYNSKRRCVNFFIGKSQNIKNRDKNKNTDSSSIVGRFTIKPYENLSFRTRFSGIPFIEKSKMIESGCCCEIKNVSAGIGYIYDSRINDLRDKSMSQLGLSLGVKISKFWKISGSKMFNFKKNIGSRNLSQGIFADYEDECFGLGFGIYKSKFKDKDIKPNTGIILTISFKNLGSISKPTAGYLYKSALGFVE